MIIVMERGAPEEAIEAVVSHLASAGFTAHRSRGATRTIIGAVGLVRAENVERVRGLPHVADVVRVSEPARDPAPAEPVVGSLVIVGLGLLGGSLAKAAQASHAARTLAAIDAPDVLAAAGALVDVGASPGTDAARDLVACADVVVLATPVAAIVGAVSATLDALGRDAVLTDVGSVKRPVIAAAERHARRRRFVPGHPMAGREIGGFAASTADLFEGARWLLVAEGADPDAVARVSGLASATGAKPVLVGADAHDRAMAFASHAPQIVASVLVEAAASAGAIPLSGPGFRDMTRVAGGPVSIWRDILAQNRAEVAKALARIASDLGGVAERLASPDAAGLDDTLAILERARRLKAMPPGEGDL